jgi:hypothetical protein
MTLSKTFRLGATVCAAVLGVAASASAATITMDAKYYSGGAISGGTSGDYVAAWNAVSGTTTPGYFNQTIADWNGNQHNSGLPGGANSALAYHDEVTFWVPTAATYSFQFGVDFGFGGTLILDGSDSTTNTGNMWWNYSYANTSSVLSLTDVALTAGKHVIDIYGFEDCCDGGTGGQFEVGSGGFQDFTSSSLVPEPAAWALMLVGFGLGGAALRDRRRAIAAV